jgi:ATP synthase j chain
MELISFKRKASAVCTSPIAIDSVVIAVIAEEYAKDPRNPYAQRIAKEAHHH